MANPQVIVSGAVVSMTASASSNTGGSLPTFNPATGTFNISYGGTRSLADTTIPASGASVTVLGGLIVTNTGTTSTWTISNQGGTFTYVVPVLTVQANTSETLAVATGYLFNVAGTITQGGTTTGHISFDLVAAINPQLPIGVQTSIPPTGTHAPTSLNWGSIPYNGWEIVNPAGTVIAWAQRYTSGGNPPTDNMNGWYTSAAFPYATNSTTGANTITSFPLTPPIGTPIATGYEIRALHGYVPAASAYFDVVPALPVVLRNQTRIIIY